MDAIDPSMTEKTEAAMRRWALTDMELIADTATSRVFRTVHAGEPAALKVLKPYGADEIHGARLMDWWDGAGAAKIIALDEDTILMEWLDGAPLGDLVRAGRDEEATVILCDVAHELHRARPAPLPRLQPLAEQFATLFDHPLETWPGSHRACFGRAYDIARELLETTSEQIPLHGDFHHDNVVGSTRGWLAIDPKGLLGDPAYEFSNVFRNPYGADETARQPERIERLAGTFAARFDIDRTRILGWAAAHCAISSCWDKSVGNTIAWNLEMLPKLLAAFERSRGGRL